MNLRLAKVNHDWWLLGYLSGPVGPFADKAEAERLRIKLERGNVPVSVTTDGQTEWVPGVTSGKGGSHGN